jgi:hypothetical protein
VTWCEPSEWGDDEVDRAAGWGAVVDWEWWGRSAEEAEPVYGRVDFCPFCGVRLVAPNATTGIDDRSEGELAQDRERLLWAILVRANEQQTIEIRRDIDACMAALSVDGWVRRELVKLGVNLDDVFHSSDDEFMRRYRAARLPTPSGTPTG